MRILATLLCLLMVACNSAENEQISTNRLNIELTSESRVAFANNKYHWQSGEQIGVYIAAQTPTVNVPATIQVRDQRGYCSVDVATFQPSDILYAYLPYSEANSNAKQVTLTIPTEQNVSAAGELAATAMPMVAEPYILTNSSDVSLYFYPMGAILCYNIYATANYAGEKVVSVRYATSTPIAGAAKHDITSSNLELKGLDKYSVQTTLKSHYTTPAAQSAATPIYTVIGAGDYSGTLTVTTNAAIYTYNLSIDTERNYYYDINIDLSKATYRKSLTADTQATATLTYAECSASVAGYKSPKDYTNAAGKWIICAYNHNKEAIQLNSGKVAYIGTPTFSGSVKSLKMTLTESYSSRLYICSEAGSTNASGVIKSFSVSGKSFSVDLSELNIRSFYIRSEACMRISAIEITYGENGGTILPDPTPEPEPEPDPTPDPDPTPEPEVTSRYAWAELPTIIDTNKDGVHDNDSNIYYAHHLCAGSEQNAQRNGTARNYTVCYSGKHHCPLWVAAPRHAMYEKKNTDRTDAYGVDPKIPSSVQYNSKSTGGGCNKGHMLGSAERLCSAATNRQVFYYTNIAPQYSSSFNTGGGAWNNLEDHIDDLVCSDTLYVVIGCYFEKFSRNGASASPKTISFGGRSDVSCPTMFYYALLRTKSGSSGKRVQDCSASELQCAAFTICHEMAKGHKPEAADMMSISELEALTGFKYFQNVPNAPKTTFSASDWL